MSNLMFLTTHHVSHVKFDFLGNTSFKSCHIQLSPPHFMPAMSNLTFLTTRQAIHVKFDFLANVSCQPSNDSFPCTLSFFYPLLSLSHLIYTLLSSCFRKHPFSSKLISLPMCCSSYRCGHSATCDFYLATCRGTCYKGIRLQRHPATAVFKTVKT
jgi:hypothetical protein